MIATISALLFLARPVEVLERKYYAEFVRQAQKLHVADDEIAYALGVAELYRITGRFPGEKKK